MFEVHIKGFKTIEAAEEFAGWFDRQGEQFATVWWDARLDEGLPVGESPVSRGITVCNSIVTITVSN